MLEAADPVLSRLETKPLPILVLCGLNMFFIVVLHQLMRFNSIYPLPWRFEFGLLGIILLVLTIAWLALLTWGTWRSSLGYRWLRHGGWCWQHESSFVLLAVGPHQR
jgi:hypothetical protein